MGAEIADYLRWLMGLSTNKVTNAKPAQEFRSDLCRKTALVGCDSWMYYHREVILPNPEMRNVCALQG